MTCKQYLYVCPYSRKFLSSQIFSLKQADSAQLHRSVESFTAFQRSTQHLVSTRVFLKENIELLVESSGAVLKNQILVADIGVGEGVAGGCSPQLSRNLLHSGNFPE